MENKCDVRFWKILSRLLFPRTFYLLSPSSSAWRWAANYTFGRSYLPCPCLLLRLCYGSGAGTSEINCFWDRHLLLPVNQCSNRPPASVSKALRHARLCHGQWFPVASPWWLPQSRWRAMWSSSHIPGPHVTVEFRLFSPFVGFSFLSLLVLLCYGKILKFRCAIKIN